MVGVWLRRLHQREIALRFVKLFSVDALAKASGFLLLPIYLRLMSPKEFGLFNYALSIVGYVGIVLNFGLYAAQSKLIHSYHTPRLQGRVLFTIYTLLAAGLVLTLLVLAISGFDSVVFGSWFGLKGDFGSFRFWLYLALLSNVGLFMLTSYFLATEQIRLTQTLNILRLVVVNGVALLFLATLTGEKAHLRFEVSTVAEIAVGASLYWFLVRNFRARFSFAIARSSLLLGLPLMLNAIVGILTNFADKWLLNRYYGYDSLSGYYLSFSIANLVSFIFASFQNVWFPLFIKEKNLSVVVERSRKIGRYLIVAGIGLVLALWVGTWIALIFHIIPDKYNAVLGILPMILLGQAFSCASLFWGNFIVYFSATGQIVKWGSIFAAVSLGLNLLLIPRWGALGASVSYVGVNFCFCLSYMVVVKKILRQRCFNENENRSGH